MADDICTVSAATCALNALVSVVMWDMILKATASDPMFVSLIKYLEAGFPDDCRELLKDLRPYHRFAASLCAGLENCTRPLVFTSGSSVRASGNCHFLAPQDE